MTLGVASPVPADLPAFRLVQSSQNARRLARFLIVMLVLTVIAMGYVPWQQSARGTGKVVASRAGQSGSRRYRHR